MVLLLHSTIISYTIRPSSRRWDSQVGNSFQTIAPGANLATLDILNVTFINIYKDFAKQRWFTPYILLIL